jgi:hypothetical protein
MITDDLGHHTRSWLTHCGDHENDHDHGYDHEFLDRN